MIIEELGNECLSVMNKKLRHSGIDIIGDAPWGTHFCQFYDSKEDLTEILVPYFKTGLENNEFCMWVTSQPLEVEEAKEALRKAVPDIDVYVEKGQLEIIPYSHWYVKEGTFDSDRVLNGWVEKLNKALANGYDGLRLTGNTFWLEKEDWNDFVDYEKEVDKVIGNYQMIALCTYNLDRCNAIEIIDVVINHQFALIKKNGKWTQIESSKRKEAEKIAILQSLRLRENQAKLVAALENMTDAVFVSDTQGKFIDFNDAFVTYHKFKNKDECSKTFADCSNILDVFMEDGTPAPVDMWAVSRALRGEKVTDVEYTLRRKDTGETWVGSYSFGPIRNKDGTIVGSIVIARDITERKKAEQALLESEASRKATEAIEIERRLFLDMLETLPIMICLLTSDYRVTFVNRNYRKQFGDSVGLYCYEYRFGFTNQCEFCESYKVLATGKPHHWEYNGMDGRVIDTYDFPFTDVDGSLMILKMGIDITEHRKAEGKIRSLANIVESSEDAILTKSLDGIITSWNKGAENIYGYLAEEVLGKNVSILEPDDLKGDTKHLIEMIKQGKTIKHYETLRLMKDGTKINVSIAPSPVFGTSGEFVAISTVARDVTEHKRAEEKIRLSDSYNRSLIEASLDPLVTIGYDGKITDVNEATEQVTGYSRDELIGTDFMNYFVEPEKAKKGYKEVFQEGVVFDYELEIQNKNGHITPVLYNASVYKDESGKIIGIFAAARDITERKRMEAELEYIARLPWENPSPVIRLTQGHKINYSNLAGQMLLTGWGCAISQEVPTAITELAIMALNDGIQRKFEHKCANNTYIINLVPFPQSGYVNLYGRDITEQKKAEKLLQLRLEELASSNEELEQFAYVSSHDLQEPLRMITSYLQLLQRRYQGQLDDKADKYIHFAVDGASRMQNLINDLLEYSRAGTKTREPEIVDCELILNKVLSNLKYL